MPITWWQSIREKSGLYFSLLLQPEFTYLEVLSTESSVDDLGTCRGVVLRRAVTILRSIETQPLTGRFVRFVEQSSILFLLRAWVWRYTNWYMRIGHRNYFTSHRPSVKRQPMMFWCIFQLKYFWVRLRSSSHGSYIKGVIITPHNYLVLP